MEVDAAPCRAHRLRDNLGDDETNACAWYAAPFAGASRLRKSTTRELAPQPEHQADRVKPKPIEHRDEKETLYLKVAP
jgi:hypothetical protein